MGGRITSLYQYLLKKGLSKRTVGKAIFGSNDVTAVDEVCVAILADIEKRRQLEADGETHVVSRGLALPDSLIDRFAYDTVRMFNKFGLAISEQLLELIKTQLHIADPNEDKASQYVVSAYLVSRHPDASNRKIAAAVGCDHTTIRRWRTEGNFQERVKGWEDIDDIRMLCDAEELNDAERKLISEQLYVEDVSGKPVRLAELDPRGNIVPSENVDALISKYKSAGIRWTVFDPAAFFSAGERFVNDGEAALMLAGRTISTGLDGAAVGFIHHTGQAAAREKVVDQYAGRGGSAFSDNSRATLVLAFHGGDKKDEHYPPPTEISRSDVDAGRVVRLHIAKFNAGRRETRPVWIVRSEQDPFKFDFYEGVSNTPQDRAVRKAATEKADDEAATAQLWHYTRDLEAKGQRWGKSVVADSWKPNLPSGATCARDRARAIVARALIEGAVVLTPLPADECQGAKKEYLAPGSHPKEPERRNAAE